MIQARKVKQLPPIVIAEGHCITGEIIYKETNMSSTPKASGRVEAKRPSLEVAGEERSVINSAREQEISRRAYEIYLERGEEPVIWRIGSKPNVNSQAPRSLPQVSRLRSLIKQQRNKT